MIPISSSVIIAALSIILTALIAYCVRQNIKIAENAVAIAVLQNQMMPLWSQVQARMANDLHHDDPRLKEADTLIEKLQALTITPEETDRLKSLLYDRQHDMHPSITHEERLWAQALPPIMDLVLIEAKKN